jgi:hypothetical protein
MKKVMNSTLSRARAEGPYAPPLMVLQFYSVSNTGNYRGNKNEMQKKIKEK